MYCGCKTCCSKITWLLSILLLLCAAAGLAAGLYVTVPCASKMVSCNKSPEANTAANQCWNQFWTCTKSGNAGGLFFFLAIAGAACLGLSLLTCCCFCCQRRPGAPPKASRRKGKNQDQFISSSEGTTTTTAPTQATATHASDSAPYSDQYSAYSGYPEPNAKPSVAHV